MLALALARAVEDSLPLSPLPTRPALVRLTSLADGRDHLAALQPISSPCPVSPLGSPLLGTL